MKKQDMKPFLWGMPVGSIVLLIVIFSAGRVVISGSAKAEDRLMAGQAVLDRLVPITVAQFMQDPKKEERLKEFKRLDFDRMNNRTDYVKKQGWATMPGEKEPDSEVADEVAKRLVEHEK